nr:hypothetical protein [Micromonospora sp. DSM 115978]
MTWAEFIEAGLLREYRRTHQVPMAELRSFIDELRMEFGVPYPLADRRPLVSGRALVVAAQIAADLDPEFWLVAEAGGQLQLLPASEAFLRRVDWDGDEAGGWRPHNDPDSPVRMIPDVRSGYPSVGGVSTQVLWEHLDGGEDFDDVATAFDLPIVDVRWAFNYEASVRAA